MHKQCVHPVLMKRLGTRLGKLYIAKHFYTYNNTHTYTHTQTWSVKKVFSCTYVYVHTYIHTSYGGIGGHHHGNRVLVDWSMAIAGGNSLQKTWYKQNVHLYINIHTHTHTHNQLLLSHISGLGCQNQTQTV